MPTNPTVIQLTYKPDPADPSDPCKYSIVSNPKEIRFTPGETVTFTLVLDQSLPYKARTSARLRINFDPPDRFQPSQFTTGDDPVKVLAAAKGVAAHAGSGSASPASPIKVMLSCILIDQNGKTIGNVTGHGGTL